MRRRTLAFITTALAAGAPAAGPALAADPLLAPPGQCPNAASGAASVPQQKAAMRCLVAYARRAAGLGGVRRSRLLGRSAQAKANLVARCGHLTHSACGRPWNEVFAAAGFRGAYYENLASGGGAYGTPRGAMGLWLVSPGHRQALLAPSVTKVGIGLRLHATVDGAAGSIWALHLGRPM